jgi:predicted PurR-regulated permease PerM
MTRFNITVTTKGALVLLVLGIGFIFLWTIRPVLPPLVWGLIVAYLLDPLVSELARRLHLRRSLVVALLVILLVVVIGWAAAAGRPILFSEVRELIDSAPRILSSVQAFLVGTGRIDIFGIIIDPSALTAELNQAIQDSFSGIPRRAIPYMLRAVGSLVQVALFFIFTFYLLLDIDKVGPGILSFLPRPWRRDVIPLLSEMEQVLGAYIRGQIILIVIMSVASFIVLTALQVRFALLLAIITGIVEIFPVIGPWTAAALVVSVSFTQDTALFGGNSAALAVAVAVAYFALREAEDLFVIPNVVGKVMELHPFVVLFALTAGSYLGGLLGLLIAVPIAAVVKLCLRYLHDLLVEEERTSDNDQGPPAPASTDEGP